MEIKILDRNIEVIMGQKLAAVWYPYLNIFLVKTENTYDTRNCASSIKTGHGNITKRLLLDSERGG